MSTARQSVQSVKEASGSLLEAFLAVQEAEGYLTEAALKAVSEAYAIPMTQIYETASFYSMFRFAPAGKTIIQVCRNAPCHVAGAGDTVAALEQALGITIGETTKDGAFTLEYTECIGQCQASPSLVINGEVHTSVTSDKVAGLLASLSN